MAERRLFGSTWAPRSSSSLHGILANRVEAARKAAADSARSSVREVDENPFAPSSTTCDQDNSDLQQSGLDQACSKRQRVLTEVAAPMKRRFKLDHFGLEFEPTSAAASERDHSENGSDKECFDPLW